MKKRRFLGILTVFAMLFTTVSASAGLAYGLTAGEMAEAAQKIEFGTAYSASWTKETAQNENCSRIDVDTAGIIGITAVKPNDAKGAVKLDIKLYDQNGQLICGSESSYSADNDAVEYSMNAGILPGTYYLTLKPAVASVEEDITTSFKAVFTEDKFCEREPNGTKNDATLMEPGKTYSGFFGTDGAYNADENDIYKFNCIKGQAYRITVGNYDAVKATSTMIELTDPSGYERIISIDLESKGNYSFTAAATGAYYIRIHNCNTAQYGYTLKAEQTSPAALSNALRICGNDRYDTAIAIADNLKKEKQIRKFDCVVVASGLNYPDALAGGCLAAEKEAPMLLVGTDTSSEKKTADYIKANLKDGGSVYILGGTGVVTDRFKNSLSGNRNVYRLSGKDRYATNLAILNNLKAEGADLLICTGNGYADSLSASAVGLPILLATGDSLTAQQRAYVEKLGPENIYIIGGTGVISNKLMNSLKTADGCNVERVAGNDRYATSVRVAEKFFPEGSSNMLMAYALNYPDGLSGGPLAVHMGAPLVLTDGKNYSYADSYATAAGASYGIVLGGPTLVTDNAVKNILD